MNSSLSLKEHLKELEEKLLKPEIRTSPEELNLLLAEEFFEYGSSGRIFYKSDCMGEGGVGVLKMTLHRFDLHILGADVAMTTYQVKDETRNRNTLRSSIWKLRDGRWQMFFHQGTITDLTC